MSAGGSDHPKGRTYVGPRYEVVGGSSESLYNGVFHDFVRDIETVRVPHKSPAWFISARIPADCDIGIEFRDNPIPLILHLYCDGLGGKIHRKHETSLSVEAAALYRTFPIATQDCSQFVIRDRRRGTGDSLPGKSGTVGAVLEESGQYRVFITSSATQMGHIVGKVVQMK